MARAKQSESTHPSGQPRPSEAPPTLDMPRWKEVMPPARMQMIEKEMAKFENPLIRRRSSCAYPMECSVRTSSAMIAC